MITRETLIDRVCGDDYVGDSKTLHFHMKRLRSKIDTESGAPKRIVTIRGVGYEYERATFNPA